MADPHTAPALHVEVAVVGAGFAGLQAALVLGRAQRDVLLLGDGPTRNAETTHTHNVLTREGAAPQELLALALAEVDALPTVTHRAALVDRIDPPADGGHLTLHLSDGTALTAAQVLLATGVRDRLPDVAGLVDLWGRRAHSCPFCDAAAYAGQPVLALAEGERAGHLAALLSGWTDRVTVLDPATLVAVAEDDDGVVATTADGARHHAAGMFVAVTPLPRLDAVEGLPVERRGPFLAVDAQHRTGVPGLRAAGDCAWRDGDMAPGGQVVAAMAAGSTAAIAIILEQVGVLIPDAPDRTAPEPAPDEDPGAAHRHGPGWDVDGMTAEAFWESRYAGDGRVWTGRVNAGLAAVVAPLPPGTALDLGCGEGGDAIWLAERGWAVTAVDISATAIERGRAEAATRGVGERITWVRADLADGLPEGRWDLVSAAYLLSPVELPREAILAQAATRVAPGGRLVVLGHLGPPPGAAPPRHVAFPTLEGDLAALPRDVEWVVEEAAPLHPRMRAPDGTVTTRTDGRIVARRA